MGATPNWSLWLNTTWGFPDDVIIGSFSGASGLVLGTNSPYFIQDFLSIYPVFGGTPLSAAATLTNGSAIVTLGTAPTVAVKTGNPIAGPGIPDGALVLSVQSTTQFTMTADATEDGASTLTIWNALPIPMPVFLAYITLAWSSLVQKHWKQQWEVGMSLYIAHYLTLWLRSSGDPFTTIGQIAANGLSFGIQAAKAVGDVSVSYTPVEGLADWGAWNLTTYGQLLATLAKPNGAGSFLCV